MTTLILGAVFLGCLTLWQLTGRNGAPPSPPTPEQPSETELKRAAAESRVISFQGRTMGTTYSIKYVPPHAGVVGMAQIVAKSALDSVDNSMSTYRATSEVGFFNRIGASIPQKTSDEFWRVLLLSKKIHDETGGAFDITVAPLVAAYGFGASAMKKVPGDETLKKIRQTLGMGLLTFNNENQTVEKTVEGVQIDLGGIAKGFGVDQVAKALHKLDIENYMAEVGGEIRVRGEKGKGIPWKLAIEEPSRSDRRLHGTLTPAAKGLALATSGDYRNFRRVNGHVISHTLDPRTGRPVPKRTASVSVVRPTAAEADGLATALGVLPPKEALALANERRWAVYLLVHDGQSGYSPRSSDAFKKLQFKRVAVKVEKSDR